MSINDETAWNADVLPDIDVRLRSCVVDDWLDGEPAAFDTHHDETARLYVTNGGVSASILGGFHPDQPGTSIPMGYTNLDLFEKRAVITDGQLVRVWRNRYSSSARADQAPFFAITQGRRSGFLRLGLYPTIYHAIGQAQTLSDRMNGDPVIVVRLLKSVGWH